ncbi:MAG: hypothetical protein HDR26_03065 [Lachnospiraceae bacterium]|nr:hypothetical protein [Lachnospiraceae bacterium]
MSIINPKESEVLKILLRSEKPLSLPTILSSHPSLIKSTVAAALAKLLKENMIEVVGIEHSGKAICRTYRPTQKSRETFLQNFTDFYSDIMDIIPKADLCMSLLTLNKDPQKAKEELAQLRAMLDKYEQENHLDT